MFLLILYGASHSMADPTVESPLNLADLKKKLTPEQYRCTQENGTERPFENA